MIAENYSKYLQLAYKITGCHHLKNDLVNDTFLKIQSILSKNPDKEINDGYVYLTMRSVFVSWKRSARETAKESGFFFFLAEEEDQTTIERRVISEALDEIPFIYREVLLKAQEVGMKEIHRGAGIPYSAVRRIKSEGEEMLREKLKQAI